MDLNPLVKILRMSVNAFATLLINSANFQLLVHYKIHNIIAVVEDLVHSKTVLMTDFLNDSKNNSLRKF